MTSIRAVSYGGGVQSTALLVLAAQGRIDFPTFLFANVGADSENPATITYVAAHAKPYAEAHGLELVELERVMLRGPDKGKTRTLLDDLTREGVRGVDIPIYVKTKEGYAPGTRNCTKTYKIKVIGRELRRRGATAEAPATVAVGFSLDEIGRLNRRRSEPWERMAYPLVGVGEDTGLRLNRLDCERLIAEAGLPVPPKSSCWFCPFQNSGQWADRRRRDPETFEQAVKLEQRILRTRSEIGKDPAWLTPTGVPLDEATATDDVLFEVDPGCDSGACFT
jgi:hypothetical protein